MASTVVDFVVKRGERTPRKDSGRQKQNEDRRNASQCHNAETLQTRLLVRENTNSG